MCQETADVDAKQHYQHHISVIRHSFLRDIKLASLLSKFKQVDKQTKLNEVLQRKVVKLHQQYLMELIVAVNIFSCIMNGNIIHSLSLKKYHSMIEYINKQQLHIICVLIKPIFITEHALWCIKRTNSFASDSKYRKDSASIMFIIKYCLFFIAILKVFSQHQDILCGS